VLSARDDDWIGPRAGFEVAVAVENRVTRSSRFVDERLGVDVAAGRPYGAQVG
jgi:hypothetical protein